MEGEIAQQNRIQASIRQETYLLKKSAKGLEDQIANMSIALRELQAEERQLSKEIVHSPDRIKVDLAEATRTLEKVKKSILNNQRDRAVVKQQMEHTTSAEESVKRIMTLMEDMGERVQEYELVCEDLEDVQNKLEGMEQSLEEKRDEKEAQEKQFRIVGKYSFVLSFKSSVLAFANSLLLPNPPTNTYTEKRKADTVSMLTRALQTVQTDLENAMEQLGVVQSERLEGLARIEASEKRVEEVKAHIEQERKMTEEEIASRIASFEKFEKRFWTKDQSFQCQISAA